MKNVLLSSLCLAALAACGGGDDAPETETTTPVDTAEVDTDEVVMDEEGVPSFPAIDETTLDTHLAVLASDEYMGRAPATEGGRMTRNYLAQQMQDVGLEPGNNGSFEQRVGLVEQAINPSNSSFTLTMADGETRTLSLPDEMVFWSKQVKENIAFEDSELVFVGFGVNAPEYGWNDYEGLDVEGKTVVMLVNDPGFYLEDERFNGRSMTYYGRWTYKYEEAARQGADAAIVIHDTDPASYGWGVVSGSWSGPQLDLERPDEGASRVMLEGWIQKDLANELFEAIDMSYDEAVQAALSDDFAPVDMNVTASAEMQNIIQRSESANIAGVLPGATRPDEYVLYMAHWDHLGQSFGAADGSEDTIHNGAVDNATGTAGLLAIAESFANAERAPDRSIMFLAVTAEESGLLGSAFYGEDPIVPLAQTVGGINMDAIAPTGPANDLIVVGYGASELEDVLKGVADEFGKTLVPDQTPEAGYFYRSDHISLAKKGVPMIYVDKGLDLVDGGVEAGRAFDAEYTENRYHKPADEYDETWRLDGLAETFTILRDVGAELAYSDIWPNWYEGNEFRALRDEQMASR